MFREKVGVRLDGFLGVLKTRRKRRFDRDVEIFVLTTIVRLKAGMKHRRIACSIFLGDPLHR